MTYADAIQFLYSLQQFGTKLGLDNTRRLAALAGNPQERLRFIHVAGTNGKGSVCAMLESIHRAAGRRTGLFTSPHLVSFCERIQVNRQPVPESDVARLVSGIKPLWEQFPETGRPTFFEVVTVMALRWFAERECDLVVWETGMGGRLDATNIVTPLASVITNVHFDHQKWLGDSLARIAAEKAGIIKAGVPALTAEAGEEALRVITDTARALDAPLTRVTEADLRQPPLDSVALPLTGAHQQWNAALALATVLALQERMPVTGEAIRRGLETVRWAGRLQLETRPSGGRILLDGAHNTDGAAILRRALERDFPGVRPVLILGVLEDKDWPAICRSLAPGAAAIHLVPVSSMRSAPPATLEPACRAANPDAPVTAHPSLDAALKQTADDAFVVVTGSLYLVGEALELLQLSPANPGGERGLNEWGAVPQNPPGGTTAP